MTLLTVKGRSTRKDCLKIWKWSLTAPVPVLQEVAILSRVENATEALLARCFENYYSLQETAPTGLLDGGVAAAEQPAPALLPAVELCNILRDVLKPGDQQWLTDRFRVAACRRYQRLVDGADATISRGVNFFSLHGHPSLLTVSVNCMPYDALTANKQVSCCTQGSTEKHGRTGSLWLLPLNQVGLLA